MMDELTRGAAPGYLSGAPLGREILLNDCSGWLFLDLRVHTPLNGEMRFVLFFSLVLTLCLTAESVIVPESLSPDGKIHVVMDVDRDPTISPEWKEGSYPQIEVTEKEGGIILASIGYFGAISDDARPLREHVKIVWRPDSKAFGVTVQDRFYSSCLVFVRDEKGKFVEVSLPSSYQELTGFPTPEIKGLRPRGRNEVEGWDENGRLILQIFRSPLLTFSGSDPLRHRVLLEVTAKGMKVVKTEHEKGSWRGGEWVVEKKELEAPN